MIYKLSLLLFCLLLPVAGATVAQADALTGTLYQTVNVRSGPDTRFAIVGQVSAGDTVLVTGRGEQGSLWLQVELVDASVGWVPSYLLLIEGDATLLPIVGIEPESEDTNDATEIVTVFAYGRVNVRSGPSILEDIIAQLDIGDEARALARSNVRNDWLYVENIALTGWVAYFTVDVRGDRALPLRVPDIATEDLVHPHDLVATLFNVQIRTEPSLDAEVIAVLEFDTEVTAFARGDDPEWIYVGTADVRGWAAAALFDITLEHLEALPTYSDEATYELLPEDVLVSDASATEEAPVGPASTPFLFVPAVQPTAEVTESS